MKILKRILLCALILSMLPVGALAAEADSPQELDLGAYYLVNEDFSLPQPNTYSAVAPSSWDIDDLGGGLSVQGNKSFTVLDNSESLSVKMRRKFNAQKGKITWEFTLKPTVIMEETRFELRQGEAAGISIVIHNGGLAADTMQGKVELSPLKLNTVCGIKVEADIENKTYVVWTDGKKRTDSISFSDSCSQLDNVYIETGKEATGSMDIGTVRVSRGYVINERFLTSNYELPEDWTAEEKCGKIAPEKCLGALYPDVYSLKITDNDFLNSSKISRTFFYEGEELWLEYQFLIPEQMSSFSMTLGMGDSDLITLGSKQEQFGYTVQSGGFQPVYNLKQNLWYHVMLKLTKEGAKVYINHKLMADNVEIPFLKVDNIRFETGTAAVGYVWLDDIIIKPYLPLPEDYVPEPKTPEHGEYLVGMQSCNMWKEGSHFGWDWINPFEDRLSYMGFYDEGSSEVKDWEIKWMIEHGIDYELFCWYRPPDGNNVPIKYPRSAYALHEGFFNAEYSNMTKFAIAWENGSVGVSGSKDFRENVVPFWIEQYFKDPRYLVVDNKPVVSIYTLSGLKKAFGDTASIRAEMDYLRQACVNAGFSGCIILLSSSSLSAEELKTIGDAGIDCIYNYSWGNSAGMVENQMSSLSTQKSLGGVDMMATMSMGRDDTPWERTGGSFASVEDFTRLLNWAKDEFIPSLPADSLGRRFIMFGNWNEYGEGHFLSPCNLAGFGYLDAIGKVFNGIKEHQDVRPTEEQKQRINHLYVQDRKMPVPYAVQSANNAEIPENVKLGYTFDDGAEGWTVAKQIEDFSVENSVMKGTSVDTDPGIYSPPDLGIAIGDVSHVRIRMLTDVTAPSVTLYYITEADSGWAETKSLKGTFRQIDGEMYDLVLETAVSAAWKGKLKQVRLDPMTETGYFEIDSIEFLSSAKEGDLALAVDGEQQFFSRPLIMKNGVLMVSADETAQLLNCSWESTIDRDGMELLRDEEDYILMTYGEQHGLYNGVSFALPEPACMIEDQAYFPLRAVAEKLGFEVEWDGNSNMADVISPTDGENTNFVPPEPDPEGSFNFNANGDLQGWSPNGNISNAKVKNGILSFQATGTDPIFTRNCELTAADYPYLHIRVKNGTIGNKFQLYFTTAEKTSLSEDKSVSIIMETGSAEFAEYTADMRSNANWTGTITRLRMDPTNNLGAMEIDYVILGKESEAAASASVGENLIPNGIMDTQNFAYTPYEIKGRYSAERAYVGRYSLLAEKQSPQGAVRIDAPLEQDKVYSYRFWVYLPHSGRVSVGTVLQSGEAKEAAATEVSEANRWIKIEGSFTQGEAAANPQIYITADTDRFYIDAVILREVK